MSLHYRVLPRLSIRCHVGVLVVALALVLGPLLYDDPIRAQPLDEASAAQVAGYETANAQQTVRGILRSVPLLGIGLWTIQTNANETVKVLVNLDTRLLQGVPPVDSWVRVQGQLQQGGTVLAAWVAPDTYEPGQLVVRLAAGVLPATITSRYGLNLLQVLLPAENIVLLSTASLLDNLVELLAQMQSDVDILWSELVYIDGMPEGDPYKTWGWGGTDPGSYINQTAFQQVNLAPAQASYQGNGIVVAVLDTGIDLNHPALIDRLISGWDMVANDSVPQDEGPGFAWGHGTHAAGIITRIAAQSQLMPVRVLESNGRGTTVKLALGIEWAVQHGADVLNISLGTVYHSFLLRAVIDRAEAAGVVVVAAAGNKGQDQIQYPAGYASVIGVTAVDAANLKASFANFGANWVDLAAPGVGITSTIIGPQGSGYASWSGTSMATPFVSGGAALARQKLPDATAAAISDLLEAAMVDLDTLNPAYAGQIGGLLNIGEALAAEPPPATDQSVITSAGPLFLPLVSNLRGNE